MAFDVRFYSFSKRTNSTKVPTGTPETYSCVLKDNTDIINPTLQIRGNAAFNPKYLNYCWIAQFSRYYFINTWRYVPGLWECDCNIDVLATFKPVIEDKEKYILRSSYRYNKNLVDTLYPVQAWQPDYYTDEATFNFSHSFDYGVYILGVANNSVNGVGAISYYCMGSSTIRRLVEYMMPTLSDWTNSFSGFTDVLYRSIYGPFDYIKSCKWFPISYTPSTQLETIRFGNYNANEYSTEDGGQTYDYRIYARPLDDDITDWFSDTRTLYLPTGWLSLDAKYRSAPYAHLYLVINPWGVIELNPLDFTNSRTIKLYIYADFVSGDGILKIYKVVGSREEFITQKTAKISIDVNLSQSSLDASGVLSGAAKTAAGIGAIIASGGIGGVVSGGIEAGSGVTSVAMSAQPTLAGSLGVSFDNAVSIEGKATLIYQSTYFADEDNTEYGKPLCEKHVISSIPGFIKCGDGDIDIAGAMKQELDMISEHLVNGFFYE